MAQDLKDTLQLPKTDFPMRADLPRREPARVAHWEAIGLYEAIQQRREGAPAFVLHDGPPFTNGDLHLGHALNSVIKDVINRFKSMRGFRTPYVPGWDCHGLPIEQKVSREIQEAKATVTTSELRARCDAFSELWIGRQKAQLKRLGLLADWKNEYKTKAPAFEADIVRTFASFVEQGLVYRSKKPVYWSIPFETALAEAEIEYKEHVSPSIWVRFAVPAAEAQKFGLPADKPLFIVIWTTTPWTLPANLAIALNPKVDYAVTDLGAERIITAKALVPAVIDAARKSKTIPEAWTPSASSRDLPGQALEGLAARHPFIDRAAPVVLADYVTVESGTGCVHTAPGHGAEDYVTGLKYKLEIYCPVGDDGRYVSDGRIPADLVGITTLESVEDLAAKRTSPANIAVLKLLAASQSLFAKQKVSHSYPHCWRSKTPIIFRAVDQWFVSLDRAASSPDPAILRPSALSPRDAALAEIGKVSWVPGWGEARIRGAVESRPDWCVSRQRAWGVPIPAFFDAKRQGYLDAGICRVVADRFAQHGTNYWYEASAAEILAGVELPAGWPPASELVPGRDTLDVWFDSGSTHAAVLKRGVGGTSWPADLYSEGSDQHRGWFQSSLWTSVIALGGAPYRSVLTHGFILDEERKKLSKSSSYEKPQTSDSYVNDYGADLIRLWISSQDFRDDVPISKEILSHVGEAYRQIRNTLRYQLAVLHDFDPARHAVPLAQLDTLDRWALHQAAALHAGVTAAYEAHEFHRVYQLCNQFCSVTLSATYHDILKDRLYTLGAASPLRRSSQTALHAIFQLLVKVLAPILTFTADEAWAYATDRAEFTANSVHLQDWPTVPAGWTQENVEHDVQRILSVRTQVNASLELARKSGAIGKSLDADVVITGPSDPDAAAEAARASFRVLQKHQDQLAELFIVSRVTLQTAGDPQPAGLGIAVRHADGTRCPRCWRWVPALDAGRHGSICPRCTEALETPT